MYTGMFDCGYEFDSYQLKTLVFDGWVEVKDQIYRVVEVDSCAGESDKYEQEMKTIIYADETYFAIDWVKDKTGLGDHMFLDQPYEVRPVSQKRTIEYIEWVPVE